LSHAVAFNSSEGPQGMAVQEPVGTAQWLISNQKALKPTLSWQSWEVEL
jgi:hypothetical protein